MVAPSELSESIVAICRQFSRATGWPLGFCPFADGVPARIDPLESEAEGCWRVVLHDGHEPVGSLLLRRPGGRARDVEYLKACETVEVLGRALEWAVAEHTRAVQWHPEHWGSGEASPWQFTETLRTRALHRLLDSGCRISGFPILAFYVWDVRSESFRLRGVRGCESAAIESHRRTLGEAAADAAALRDGLVVVRSGDRGAERWLPRGASLGICQGVGNLDRSCGTLWAFDRRSRRLNIRDRHVLESLAVRLGEWLDRAAVADEGAEQRRLRSELKIAARAQGGETVRHTGTSGWCEVAGRLENGREVGGDLCELLPLPGEKLFLTVGDAVGHSIPAAMVMATVRGALRLLFEQARGSQHPDALLEPNQVLALLNAVLHGVVKSHQFMTGCCGLLDGPRMRLDYANAGHPPPLLVRDNTVEPLSSHGVLLGVVGDASYSRTAVYLQPGDLLVLFTDGVTEAPNHSRRLFRTDGVAELVLRHQHESAETILEHIWSALDSHTADTTMLDDRTLIVVRIVDRCPIEPGSLLATGPWH
jgi:sigma-B regulation protein RsbU (phosphoserine phosphatase)